MTEHQVIWQAPKGVGEESFQIQIADIAKAICESSRSSDSSWYYIEMLNGEKHSLISNSGINVARFCWALEKRGVKYEKYSVN